MPIVFTIPEALPVSNVFLRLSHWQRSELRARVRMWVRVGLNAAKHWPGSPVMTRCRIHITRVCERGVDPDGLPTCAKHILDVLQPRSTQHPDGLGVIAQDNAECIIGGATIDQRRTEKGERAHMRVEIEPLP